MAQQTQKKEWKTPELIVLVRSKPEEAVLASCKTQEMPMPERRDDGCFHYGCLSCNTWNGD